MESKWRRNESLYGLSYFGPYFGDFSGPRPLYAQLDETLLMNAFAGPFMGMINPYQFFPAVDERVPFGQISTSYAFRPQRFPYGIEVEPDLPG